MRPTSSLSPEQRRAVEVFEQSIPLMSRLMVRKVEPEHVSTTDSKIFVEGKIGRKSLPHEHHWVWNQSKSQKSVRTTANEDVVMYKLNPRKKSSHQVQPYPSYKLWVFVMKGKLGSGNVNFLWCEKGESTSPTDVDPSIQRTEITSLNQLSFLSEFMEPKTAYDLFGMSSNATCQYQHQSLVIILPQFYQL